MKANEDYFDQLEFLITRAKKLGADEVDTIIINGIALSSAYRLGKTERIERSEAMDLGIRVFKGNRQAIASSSDLSLSALKKVAERAMAMAKSVPEDPYCGIADRNQVANTNMATLDLVESREPTIDDLTDRARASEEAARSVNGVTNSEGAEASWTKSSLLMSASNGFNGTREMTNSTLSVSVLAGEGTMMERDYDYASAVFSSDLPCPSKLGRQAGEKAVARLGPKKVGSSQLPIIFTPRVSGTILGHLSHAINGAAIAGGTSFLKDKMGKRIFPKSITIIDDPLRSRGLRSKQFDGEGLQTSSKTIIDQGELKSWILNLRSARQLKLSPSAHASRSASSPPSANVTNFFLESGDVSPSDLISANENALLVTEMIGHGINYVTGDYSRGASGFWIENGEIVYPVNEITIAGNLSEMFANVTAADDLEFKYGIDAPTLRIDGMTIAGK